MNEDASEHAIQQLMGRTGQVSMAPQAPQVQAPPFQEGPMMMEGGAAPEGAPMQQQQEEGGSFGLSPEVMARLWEPMQVPAINHPAPPPKPPGPPQGEPLWPGPGGQ
jgi:hypothetical protein